MKFLVRLERKKKTSMLLIGEFEADFPSKDAALTFARKQAEVHNAGDVSRGWIYFDIRPMKEWDTEKSNVN